MMGGDADFSFRDERSSVVVGMWENHVIAKHYILLTDATIPMCCNMSISMKLPSVHMLGYLYIPTSCNRF